MMEILLIGLFVWLFFKVVGLAFRVAWGAVKFVSLGLLVFAVPLLIGIALFTGGLLLLLPVALVGLAFVLLVQCA